MRHMKSAISLAAALTVAFAFYGCNGSDDTSTTSSNNGGTTPVTQPTAPSTPVAEVTGKWTTGDLHVHTIESDDAQGKLVDVLDQAMITNNLDWTAISNHLRVSTRDQNGTAIVGGPIPYSKAMADYEIPAVRQLQVNGSYINKLIFSAFEWDMPTHDHMNVGIFTGAPLATATKAANQFEYYFTDRPAAQFDAVDVANWNAKGTKGYTTHADAVRAVAWLRDNFPDTSYALINHPSRNTGKYTVADYREFNDTAPNVAFGVEGMVGNQMEPDRGGYTTAYVDANLKNRVYGGVDYVVAQVGGIWDALLGDGRRFWNVGDSDHHFKTITPNSSGYFPGEYAKTYVWIDNKNTGVKGVLEGVRSGKMFSVFGDLINALDFNIAGGAGKGEMGGELKAKAGETVTVTIRFKSPDRNNYQYPINGGVNVNMRPVVDHIDLIAGDVTPRAASGTPEYSKDTNDSTKVIATFTSADWKQDKDGYNTVTYTYVAAKNQYFRLRGTNLGMNVAGETSNGNPLPDLKTTVTEDNARFNAINARNYNDLWFYSNPVFVTVGS
ncbi:S-layer protein [Cupriavidus pauculus]|uniref:S-layer protein n=1 Tax=Cupriavidus pauculus TaxID=82633 RepID=UPI001EE377D5|nr:S-layer protein [Cupriavidus pauculus]GJG96965.1 PHP domain-containing protein [Cupriavidus pauculus]